MPGSSILAFRWSAGTLIGSGQKLMLDTGGFLMEAATVRERPAER
jgi:hypothetical protein